MRHTIDRDAALLPANARGAAAKPVGSRRLWRGFAMPHAPVGAPARRAVASEAPLAMALMLLGVATRWATRSHVLYHWDSVNFALALERYDLAAHQPHPPGYVLYVLLGRLVNGVVGDANDSLVLISVLASGLAIPMAYLLARDLFDRCTGIYAALLTATGPLVWFYGSVALSYIVELFFTGLIAWLCYHSLTGRRGFLVAASVALAVAGGVRQNTLPLMVPLWLFCIARAKPVDRPWALVGLVLPALVWGAAMLHLSGGLGAYLRATAGQASDAAVAAGLGSLTRIAANLLRLTVYALYALTLGLAVLPLLIPAGLRDPRRYLTQPCWQVLGLWMTPSALFYALFVQQAGYSFTFMLALVVVVAYGLRRLDRRGVARRLRGRNPSRAALALVIACNLAFFLLAPPFLLGMRRQLLSAPSLPAIRQRDRSVQERVAFVRARFAPHEAVIVASSFDFRLPDYYLREYRRLSAVGEANADPTVIPLAEEITTVVLFDDGLSPTPAGPQLREAALPSGASVRWFGGIASQELVLNGATVGLAREARP